MIFFSSTVYEDEDEEKNSNKGELGEKRLFLVNID